MVWLRFGVVPSGSCLEPSDNIANDSGGAGWRCGWLRVNPIQIAKSFEFDNCVLHRRFAANPAVLLDVFQYSFLVTSG